MYLSINMFCVSLFYSRPILFLGPTYKGVKNKVDKKKYKVNVNYSGKSFLYVFTLKNIVCLLHLQKKINFRDLSYVRILVLIILIITTLYCLAAATYIQ